jgi:hypothetical protein
MAATASDMAIEEEWRHHCGQQKQQQQSRERERATNNRKQHEANQFSKASH